MYLSEVNKIQVVSDFLSICGASEAIQDLAIFRFSRIYTKLDNEKIKNSIWAKSLVEKYNCEIKQKGN